MVLKGKIIGIFIWCLFLTGCYGDQATLYLSRVDVAIETPKYFIVGKPAMIKFKLIGDKSISVEGKATLYHDRIGTEKNSEIKLTADKPELTIEYTPKPYDESPYAQVKFDGRSTENVEIHSDSLKPLLDPKLSLGSSNQIRNIKAPGSNLQYGL